MKYFFTMLLFAALLSLPAYGQKDTVVVPSDYGVGEGSLNTAIQNAITAGTFGNTVFKLQPYGLYIINGTITTPQGQELEVVGPEPGSTQETAPPMLEWTSSGGVSTTSFFDCFGDIKLKNIWLLYANTAGTQVGTDIAIEDDSLANLSGKGEHATFDNVIFDYCEVSSHSGGAVDVLAKHFKGTFTNCYFRNDIDPHFRYYGRALSFPYNTTGYHIDSVLFQNCTFANMGYVYMQEGAEYGDNVHFNHCTFLNVVMYSLESGWWHNMYVTNSIFVNTFMFGEIPAQTTGDPYGGTIRIDSISNFGFSVPFTEQDRHVLFANNSYDIQPWLVSWMQNNPYSKDKHKNRADDEIPIPMPMLSPGTLVFFDSVDANGNKLFPLMNKAHLYDNSDPRFTVAPTNIDSLEQFLYQKWGDNQNVDWAYKPQNDVNQVWPLGENMAYANDTLKTAAMDGLPLGDLYHWWPTEYTQWAAQKTAEYNRIDKWLNTGKDPGVSAVNQLSRNNIPSNYTLSQNYPNPFNPTTQIKYSIAKAGYVSLKVYNVIGQKVATLFSGEKPAGNYVATFNGSNLSSGIYFYRLQAGNVSITKKLILMK